jgi:hypothetical protein
VTCTSGTCGVTYATQGTTCNTNNGTMCDGSGHCVQCTSSSDCHSSATCTNGICEHGACTLDTDCPRGQWCNESLSTCEPQLANGQPIPNDPSHHNPTLNGTCTVQAGATVCQSGVCDTTDNKCGYASGHGPCTSQNGSVVCRSGVCTQNNVCQ